MTQGKGRFVGSSIRAAGGGLWTAVMSPLSLKQCGPLSTLVPRRALRPSAVVLDHQRGQMLLIPADQRSQGAASSGEASKDGFVAPLLHK